MKGSLFSCIALFTARVFRQGPTYRYFDIVACFETKWMTTVMMMENRWRLRDLMSKDGGLLKARQGPWSTWKQHWFRHDICAMICVHHCCSPHLFWPQPQMLWFCKGSSNQDEWPQFRLLKQKLNWSDSCSKVLPFVPLHRTNRCHYSLPGN